MLLGSLLLMAFILLTAGCAPRGENGELTQQASSSSEAAQRAASGRASSEATAVPRSADRDGELSEPADREWTSDESAHDESAHDESAHDDSAQADPVNLLSADHLEYWKPSQLAGQGATEIGNDQIELEFGYTMTGVIYSGDFPRNNYRVTYQARRLDGTDFFGTVTFPVGDSHCSFVLGGWGGATIGLSNLDGEDASRNETSQIVSLDDGQWHRVAIEVRLPRIQVELNGEPVVQVDTTGRKVDIRPDVAACRPFGFCAYETRAAIRKVQLVRYGDPGHTIPTGH